MYTSLSLSLSMCVCARDRQRLRFATRCVHLCVCARVSAYRCACACVCACVCVYRRCECCPGDGAGWGSCQHLETLSTPEVLPCVKTNYINFRKIFIFFREFFCVFFYTRQHLWCRQRFKKNVVPTPWICKYALLLYLSQMYYKHTHTRTHTPGKWARDGDEGRDPLPWLPPPPSPMLRPRCGECSRGWRKMRKVRSQITLVDLI